MHFHRWPEGTPLSPAPTYSYGTVRSHDYRIPWHDVHTGPGTFNWASMDNWVQTHRGHGKTLIYTLYGTPRWAAAMPATIDAFGKPGAGGPPQTLEYLAEFVTAVVQRYNTSRDRGIHFFEIWNEPHFQRDNKGFWWGGPDQLAAMGRVVYQSAKRVDPGITILSPGFDGIPTGHFNPNQQGVQASMRLYLQAPDGNGSNGAHWLDGIAIHTYDAYITDPTHGIEGTLLQVTETLQHLGIRVPVYTTEAGYGAKTDFGRGSLAYKATLLRRQAAAQAAYGVKALCYYAHDDDYIGNPSQNPIIANALTDISNTLAGRQLKQVTVLPTGEVRVITQSGTVTW